MTTMQLAIIAGALIGGGLAAALMAYAPTRPALVDFLGHLSPYSRLSRTSTVEVADYKDRVGVWLIRRTPLTRWVKPPTKDLDLLQIPLHRFYADKAIHAALGLALPLIAGAAFAVVHLPVPFVFPAAAGLVLAAMLSFLPDLDVKSRAGPPAWSSPMPSPPTWTWSRSHATRGRKHGRRWRWPPNLGTRGHLPGSGSR